MPTSIDTKFDTPFDIAQDNTLTPTSVSRAHFIGIGGAGMSGIAKVLHERGCTVTGSDLKESHYVRQLEEEGIKVFLGHKAATINAVMPEVCVISSAIPETNPELMRARELGIKVWPRAKMLSYLSGTAQTIAVAGTHGKTTTSSMIATLLDHVGKDPSFLIGGIVEEYGTNGKNGKGDYFVCEADESDGSFLYLHPGIVVVTNIEEDHLDHYGTLENIEKTFCEFMSLVGKDGFVVINGDNPHYVELAKTSGAHVVTYGLTSSCDFVCVPQEGGHALASHFEVLYPSGASQEAQLPQSPGVHNMLNATAALAVASLVGIEPAAAAQALKGFKGAHRRFTHVGDIDGITVVDDYGHHPTEIKATLAAAKDLDYQRIVCVFQPHRYSRTQLLADQFATAFNNADVLIVTEIFAAGETPIPGVTAKMVAQKVQESGFTGTVRYIPKKKDVITALVELCRPGDLVITQGAGDITALGSRFIKAKMQG